MSNLNRFSNVLHCWKAYEICYKTHTTLPNTPRYVATLPWEIKNFKFSADIQQIWKKMQTNCILSAPVVLPIVRWSDREHLFVRKEDEVSGRLREFLKQNLSALHASSAVRVCQLLCTAPLETFQTQFLTHNLGHRRPMNTCLPWYLTDSPVGLRLVMLTQV